MPVKAWIIPERDFWMITPQDVRIFIQDKPELNRLLDKEEFSQEQIDHCMKLAVMAFNEISPGTTYNVGSFPFQYTLFIGTMWHLLFGGGLVRSRNRLPHQAGGVSVDDEAHADIELQLSATLKQEFERQSQRIKIENNLRSGWGNVSSEYVGSPFTSSRKFRI